MTRPRRLWQLFLRLREIRREFLLVLLELREYRLLSPDMVRSVRLKNNNFLCALRDLEQLIQNTLQDALSTSISRAGTETTSQNGSGESLDPGLSANLDLSGEDVGEIPTTRGTFRPLTDLEEQILVKILTVYGAQRRDDA